MEASEIDTVGEDPDLRQIDRLGKSVVEVSGFYGDAGGAMGGAPRCEQAVASRRVLHDACSVPAEEVASAERDEHRTIARRACRHLGHHAAVHHVQEIRVGLSDGAVYSLREVSINASPVVAPR